MAKGVQAHGHGPVRNPGVNVPAGMLKVTLHDVELTMPSLCFCVIKIGPHWGRTATMMAASKATWDWEVSMKDAAHHKSCNVHMQSDATSALCSPRLCSQSLHQMKPSWEQMI